MTRAVRRLVMPRPRPYRPDFGANRLQRAVAGSGAVPGASASPATAGAADVAPERDAIRDARQRFGARFFVHPQNIPRLWQQLADTLPEWHDRQLEAVRVDAQVGLPVYATRGPVLGPGFPWARLPEGPGGDGMYAKRPHRFAFAPRHALACHHDSDAAGRLSSVLRTWMDCAERGDSSYCYDSNLGVIQRLLALSWCWVFVAGRGDQGGEVERELEWLILRIIEADIRFLEPRLGHSAPNNHLLADRFAAWYLRTVFPELLAGSGDGNEEAEWRDELLRQTYPDGGGFEHSTHYHEFACEMGVAYLLLCGRQGRVPDPHIEDRVEALLHFQCALTGPECVPLPLGNAVEDALFPLDPGEGWCSGSLREFYRAMFRPDQAPAPVQSAGWVRAFWLLGGKLAPAPQVLPPEPIVAAFPDAGIYVLTDLARTARLTFRSAPRPGVEVFPGHMHADQLSVCLTVDGRPLIVDPGTYTYRSASKPWKPEGPPWRTWFSGPAAHNALAIDNDDPLGPFAGDFRQSGAAARAETFHRSSEDLVVVHAKLTGAGVYEGTERTCIGILGEYWLILDHAPSSAGNAHCAYYGFQLNSGAKIESQGRCALLCDPTGRSVTHLAYSKGLHAAECIEGSKDPVGGWISPSYGLLEPAPRPRFALSKTGPTAFLLRPCADDGAVWTIEEVAMSGGGSAVRIACGECEDVVFTAHRADGGPEGKSIEYQGLQFDGLICWLRLTDGQPDELRWLDGCRLTWRQKGLDIRYDGACDVRLMLGTNE